jgi:hypothetical protein
LNTKATLYHWTTSSAPVEVFFWGCDHSPVWISWAGSQVHLAWQLEAFFVPSKSWQRKMERALPLGVQPHFASFYPSCDEFWDISLLSPNPSEGPLSPRSRG